MVPVSIESLFAARKKIWKRKYITTNQINISCRKQKAKYSVAEKYFSVKNIWVSIDRLTCPPWNTNIVQWTIIVTSPIKMFGVTPGQMDWPWSQIHPLLLSPLSCQDEGHCEPVIVVGCNICKNKLARVWSETLMIRTELVSSHTPLISLSSQVTTPQSSHHRKHT